jgi:protein OPY2
LEKPTPPPSVHNVRVYPSSNATIDLDPESTSDRPYNEVRASSQSNPFSDRHTIDTTSSEGNAPNVIPIALYGAGDAATEAAHSSGTASSTSSAPQRPARSPDLNLDHVNVSRDELRTNSPQELSVRSGVTGAAEHRHSYMSNASYASEFLNEAPVIVNSQSTVRQVLGVHKAEMVQTPSSQPGSPASSQTLRTPSLKRPSGRSPLAATSFTPADAVSEEDENDTAQANPFSDDHASTTTFGSPSPGRLDNDSIREPRMPWVPHDPGSRPSSISTQAGSVIDISSATRVNVGLNRMASNGSSTFRNTMARIVSPQSSQSPESTFEEQQKFALAHAQGMSLDRRISSSSVATAATGVSDTDSVLGAFPFVPPSPISSRPIRSPPRSPLAEQSFTPTQQTFQNAKSLHPPSSEYEAEPTDLPPPPSRQELGLSIASNASTGLGSFTFHIEDGSAESAPSNPPPSSVAGRQRASLDTLALTSDLSSYPLGFDSTEAKMNYPYKKA